jgi:hypothetical protein
VRPLAPLLVASTLAACGHHSSTGEGVACTGSSQCAPGLSCFSGTCAARAAASATCTPPGNPRLSVGAPVDAVAPADPTACALPLRESVFPATIPLGQHTVRETLTFTVPPGIWSATILQQAADSATAEATIDFGGTKLANSVVPTDLFSPDGKLFYSDTATPPKDATNSKYYDYTSLLSYYGGYTPGTGAFTFPNTSAGLEVVRSAGALTAGQWRFTVNDFSAECAAMAASCTGGTTTGRYDVKVLLRSGPETSTGSLDVDVYVVSAKWATAADAAADGNVARMMRSLATVLGHAGICLGNVVLHDVPQWMKTQYASVSVDGTPPCDALSQLFTLATAPSTSVHLFLLDELTTSSLPGGGSGYQLVGIDGSIPGPSGVPGTIIGGAAVTVADLGSSAIGACTGGLDIAHCSDDSLAYVVAHEMGHWLGLYHPTEQTGDTFDPLSDTPRCPCSTCAVLSARASCAENNPSGQPTVMDAGSCNQDASGCGGATNVMFWLLDPSYNAGVFTPQQSEVMRLNPAVH